MRGFKQVQKLLLVAFAVIAASFGVVACGSDNGGGDSGSSGGAVKGDGVKAGTGTRAEKAIAAGTAAGTEAGAKTLEPKTIGIINFLGGIESSDRLKSTAELAATKLGYKSIVCDGKGTPTVFVTCGNSLLDQGVDAIVEIAIEPGTIQPVLDKANKKDPVVPIIQIGGGAVPIGDLAGTYGPDEIKAGQLLTDYLAKELDALPEATVPVIVHDFPAAWGKLRTDQFRKFVKTQDKIKIAATTITDAGNLVQSTRKIVGDQLTANPDVKAFWFTFDTTGQVGGQVITAKFPGKAFPDKPLVATFHADLGTLDLMAKGNIDVTSEANYDAASWIALDQLASAWAYGTEISKVEQPIYPGVGDLFGYQIITKDNLPTAGEYVAPPVDVVSFFNAKWKAQYGV
ncbi:unannotated protein [freshwater metagenome]|uniref:Unannotated protein n=1 Tax=freshwater metagenome TaxID=449393 RepID=A0A6J7EDG7_9ZZZZ|nr:substrate-binding domain-containing protein [Actinomycetota bacterium]